MSKFLGVGVTYIKDDGYILIHTQCIRDILVGLSFSETNPARFTPIVEEQDDEDEGDLLPSDGDGTTNVPTVKMLQSLNGNLLRLSRCTRPDIAFDVHLDSRQAHAPRYRDWR